MDFALSDDHQMLRDSARAFLDKEISLAPLLVPGATVAKAGYPANWAKIRELGWQGLVIPETYGGSGLSCLELVMILGETGRTLAPSPLLGNLFGTWALLECGTETQKRRLLPKVSTGDTRLALAIGNAKGDTEGRASDVVATMSEGEYRVSGAVGFVVDGLSADWLVIAARNGADGPRGLFLVNAAQPAVARSLVDWHDVTREVCALRLDGAAAELLVADDSAHWPRIRDRILVSFAAESAAGTRQVLDATVAYAKERVAFGRPIGANQALKHSLAEMLGQAECAQVATLYAAWALSGDMPDGSRAAAIAKAYAGDVYVAAAHRSIQIFGAIGFTWEMVNHLYFKRARANAALFGDGRQHRARAVQMALASAAH